VTPRERVIDRKRTLAMLDRKLTEEERLELAALNARLSWSGPENAPVLLIDGEPWCINWREELRKWIQESGA